MARSLKRIEQAKKDSGGEVDRALDAVAVLVLENDDPDGVFEEVLRLFREIPAEPQTADTTTSAA